MSSPEFLRAREEHLRAIGRADLIEPPVKEAPRAGGLRDPDWVARELAALDREERAAS